MFQPLIFRGVAVTMYILKVVFIHVYVRGLFKGPSFEKYQFPDHVWYMYLHSPHNSTKFGTFDLLSFVRFEMYKVGPNQR